MSESRLKNSFGNSITAVGSQLLVTVLNFACRSVFIYVLGSEYLGVNGLFSNILSMLSLSEMGIGTAIVYNMYRAVEFNDQEQINRLMSFYAKVYSTIGFVIMFLGIGCSFFLQYLIKDNPFELSFLRVSFLLLVFNNAVSYFWSYRSCIVFVNQKDWICKISSTIVLILGNICQILVLIFVKNYIAYLVMQIVVTIANNSVQFIIAKKMYPNVKIDRKSHLKKDTYDDIIKRIKALLIHSVSGAINFGTDNLIISKFVGILETGYYSNYSMIINTLNSLITQLLNGVIASMGNLMVASDKNKIYEVFKKINFLSNWLYGTIAVGFFAVLDQFINLWTGKGHLLNRETVIVLIINFYVLGVRQPVMITRNAGGLYTNDRFVAVIKPIVNLFFSIILVQKIGILGVFIGTSISQIVADVFLFPYVMFKCLFREKLLSYYINYFINLLLMLICGVFSTAIISYISDYFNGILLLLVSGCLSVLLFNVVYIILNFRTKEFRYFLNLLKHKLR